MNGRRLYLGLITALISALLLIACGQSSQRRLPSASFQPASISLSDALAELDAMQAPANVDAAVFSQLKGALRGALIARGVDKLISTPPTGAANAVPDFAIADAGGGTADLTWRYYNLGDYNQDGTVGIADITPLAMHFGQSWIAGEENTLPCVVDGSGDGTVNIADVTPIAMNFSVEAASYVIESSDAEGGTYAAVQSIPVADGLDKDSWRMRFAVNITPTPAYWYHVVPTDSSLAPGIISNAAQFLSAGTPVASIVPDATNVTVGTLVVFDASSSTDDGTIDKYEWDYDNDGVFDADTGLVASTNVTFTMPGVFTITVRVTDNDGLTDTASVDITVTGPPQAPVASIVSDVDHGTAPLSVHFDASGSTDSDGTIVKYEWDFAGDGTFELDTGTSSAVDYTYTSDGIYSPAVRVTDNDSMTGTASTPVYVSFAPWVHTWGDAGSDWGSAIVEGPSGHLYLAGASDSYKGGFFISTLVTQYTPAGDVGWAKTWEGPLDEFPHDVAVDLSDNVYVVGETYSFSAGSDTDAFVLKFDSTGALLFQETFGGTGSDTAVAVDVDVSGNCYFAGHTDFNLSGDIYVAKLNNIGVPMWQRVWSKNGYESADNLVVDSTGSVFVVGSGDSFGASSDVIVLKYDTDGNLIWQTLWSGAGEDYPVDLALDVGGNVYVVGQTNSFGAGSWDIFLLKLDPTGTLIWQQTWGTPGNEFADRIAVYQGLDVYIAGSSNNTGTGTTNGVLLHYDYAGALVHQMAWVEGSSYTSLAGMIYSSDYALYLVGYAPDAGGAWAPMSGLSGVGLGTPSAVLGNPATPTYVPFATSGVITDRIGIIDTGGGSSDQLIIRENPLFW